MRQSLLLKSSGPLRAPALPGDPELTSLSSFLYLFFVLLFPHFKMIKDVPAFQSTVLFQLSGVSLWKRCWIKYQGCSLLVILRS